MELSRAQRWLESVSTPVELAGISILLIGVSAAWVATLGQHSSDTHKFMSVASLWVVMQVPSLWKSEKESETQYSPIWERLLRFGIPVAVWLTFPVLLMHVLWAAMPELVQIVLALAGLHFTVSAFFVWSALGAFVGVALSTKLFRRN